MRQPIDGSDFLACRASGGRSLSTAHGERWAASRRGVGVRGIGGVGVRGIVGSACAASVGSACAASVGSACSSSGSRRACRCGISMALPWRGATPARQALRVPLRVGARMAARQARRPVGSGTARPREDSRPCRATPPPERRDDSQRRRRRRPNRTHRRDERTPVRRGDRRRRSARGTRAGSRMLGRRDRDERRRERGVSQTGRLREPSRLAERGCLARPGNQAVGGELGASARRPSGRGRARLDLGAHPRQLCRRERPATGVSDPHADGDLLARAEGGRSRIDAGFGEPSVD